MRGFLLRCVSAYPGRVWFATLGLACFGIVMAGMELQHLLRLAPCPYCIFQRLLYMLVGLIAVMGFVLPSLGPLWAVIIIGLALLGAGISSYQSWMQIYRNLRQSAALVIPT